MNWDAIGALGEIIGALAVVITLIYLSAQIRQASESAKSSNVANFRLSNFAFVAELIRDKDLLDLYTRAQSGAEITREEKIRFDLVMLLLFRATESIHLENEKGGVDEELWESTNAHFGWVLSQPGARASWDRQKRLFTRSFREHFDREVEKSGA